MYRSVRRVREPNVLIPQSIMIGDSENMKSSDSESEYIEYGAPNDTTFEVSVDFVLSSLVERDEESRTWRFRKGSGSALVSLFTTENGRPIPFVSTVERGSRPCAIGSSSTRSYMYQVVKCAHRNNQAKGVRPCKARATLKFSILSEEDFQRAGISYRLVHVIWDRNEDGIPIPCLHLRGAIARGIVRKAERLKLMETTAMPSHMTIKSVESHDGAVEQLLTGNRTGLLISQGAAHKARSRGRKELFHQQGDTFLDLRRAQRDSWEAHDQHGFQNLPIHGKLKSLLGSVHDLQNMDDGGFSRLTLFTAVSFEIHRRLVETGTENAKVVLMDSTLFRERELMVSVKTDYVKRSIARGSKLRYTEDKKHVWVKPMHTFLVVRLGTGTQKNRQTQPYVCAEHISIERTAGEMIKFLETYFRRLEFYLGLKAYPLYFVSDEDKAYTAAATWVFNRMYVSEYGALMMLSAQRRDETIRFESVRTTLVHCTVHKSRNLRQYIHDLARERKENKDGEVYSSLNRFFQQLFAFVRSADSYEELSCRTGVVSQLLSTETLPYVQPGYDGKVMVVVSEEECVRKGGEELWRGLTPTNKPPPQNKSVHRVRLESRLGKEQLNWGTEVQLNKDLENERTSSDGNECETTEAALKGSSQRPPCSESCRVLKEKGVCALLYGRFNAFVRYETKQTVDGVDRLVIQFHCPFLSGFGYGTGGFKILCTLNEGGEEALRSPLWAEGRSLQFFRSSVLGNAVFLCDAITGKAPLTHNTSVEIAIRNRKHVDEIVLLMRTCSKGMCLAEYVSRRSKWIDRKNRVQLSLLACGPLSARKRKVSNTFEEQDGHTETKKKRSRLTDVLRTCNVDELNQTQSAVLLQGSREHNSAIPRRRTQDVDQLPSTQLSLSQEQCTESVWSSTRGVSKTLVKTSPSESCCGIAFFMNTATAKLREILSPFGPSKPILSLLTSHIQHRAETQLENEEVRRVLNAVICFDSLLFSDISKQIALNSWFTLLQSSTVWDEGSLDTHEGNCKLLPFVQKRIASVKDDGELDIEIGVDLQSEVKEAKEDLLEDIRVLVAPKLSSKKDSKLSPRIVDGITNLYSKLIGKGRKKILVQNSRWLQNMSNRNISMSRKMTKSDLDFLITHTKKGLRSSNLTSWDEAEKVLCPFLLNANKKGEKWICLAVCKTSRTICVYDSLLKLGQNLCREAKQALMALKTYLVYHSSASWAGKYSFSSYDLAFPQEVGLKDSGVFILLACRFSLLGVGNRFSQADVECYRSRFANELLVNRAS